MLTKYNVLSSSQVIKSFGQLIRHDDQEMAEKLEKCHLSVPNSFQGMSVPALHKVISWVKKYPALMHLAHQKIYSLTNCPKGITTAQFKAFNQLILCHKELQQKRQIFNELKLIHSLPNNDNDVLGATPEGTIKYLTALAKNANDNQTYIGYSLALSMIHAYNSIIDNPPMTYNVMPLKTQCSSVHGMLRIISTGKTTLINGRLHFKPMNDKKICNYTAASLRRDIKLSIRSITKPSIHYLADLVCYRLHKASAKNINGQLSCIQTAVDRWNDYILSPSSQYTQKVWIRNFNSDGATMVGSRSNGDVYITYGKAPHDKVIHYTKSDLKADLHQTLNSILGKPVKPVKLNNIKDSKTSRSPHAKSTPSSKSHGNAQLSLF